MLCVLHELRGYRRLPFRIAHLGKHKKLRILLATVLLLSLLGVCILTEVKLYHHLRSIFGGNKDASENWSDKGHVVPPNEQVDYLLKRRDGRGNTVRVMLAVVATQITEKPCFSIASAHFADLPIVAVGNGEKYDHNSKIKFTLDAARLAGMSDSDVVMVLDSDIIFTGQDMTSFFDKFITTSPQSVAQLDAKAVREGRAMAPIVFSSGTFCNVIYIFTERIQCEKAHTVFDAEQWRYATAHSDSFKPVLNPPLNTLRYLNSGACIQRVWALRELVSAMNNYTATNRPVAGGLTWHDDQSVIYALFMDTMQWEMTQDVYFNVTTEEAAPPRTQYGLPAGLIALDWSGEPFVSISYNQVDVFDLTTGRWNYDLNGVKPSANAFDKEVYSYIKGVYEGSKGSAMFAPRNLTRTFSTITSIDVCPPLFSVKGRYLHGPNKQPVRTYPVMLHFSDYDKPRRLRASIIHLPWYVKMAFDQTSWLQGREYLLTMPVDLNRRGNTTRVSYAAQCGQHPFSRVFPLIEPSF